MKWSRVLPVLLFVCLFLGATGDRQTNRMPYNILFVVVDDLRPELGTYGSDYIFSPNIDRLAEQGLVFDKAYSQAPICSPSRMSFLSGLRPIQTGINDNDTPLRDRLPDVLTLPQYFKNHGYQTIGLGKVFHQGIGDTASWDYYWDEPPNRTYNLRKNIILNDPRDKVKRGLPYEAADVPDNAYTDGIIADRAIAWLDHFDRNRPFFLAVGLLKPHLPFNAPAKYWRLYDSPGKTYERLTEQPDGAPSFAFNNSGELRRYHKVPKEGPIPDDLHETLVHGYFASISYMDAQVGRLLSKLEDIGMADRTIIVLFGDHGYKLGDFGHWGKNTHFEFDVRVPLIISHPSKGATRTSSIAELIDLYPTLVDAAGIGKMPTHLSGTSLMPLFDHPENTIKMAAFSQRPKGNMHGYSVRTERYRLVQWLKNDDPSEAPVLELYDYSKNAVEHINVAGRAEYKHEVENLLALLVSEAAR